MKRIALLVVLAGARAAAAGPMTGIGSGLDLQLHLDRIITLGPTFATTVGSSRHAGTGEMSFGMELLVFRELPFDAPGSVGKLCGLMSCRDLVAGDRPAFDPVLLQGVIEGGFDAGAGGHVHAAGAYGVGPLALGLGYVFDRAAGHSGHALSPELTLNRRLTDAARSPVLQLTLRSDVFVAGRGAFDDRVLAGLRLIFDLI